MPTYVVGNIRGDGLAGHYQALSPSGKARQNMNLSVDPTLRYAPYTVE